MKEKCFYLHAAVAKGEEYSNLHETLSSSNIIDDVNLIAHVNYGSSSFSLIGRPGKIITLSTRDLFTDESTRVFFLFQNISVGCLKTDLHSLLMPRVLIHPKGVPFLLSLPYNR